MRFLPCICHRPPLAPCQLTANAAARDDNSKEMGRDAATQPWEEVSLPGHMLWLLGWGIGLPGGGRHRLEGQGSSPGPVAGDKE